MTDGYFYSCSDMPERQVAIMMDRADEGFRPGPATARRFNTARDAEKSARRSGAGTDIWWRERQGTPPVLVASIVKNSAHIGGIITEVTWEGGKWL